MAAGKTTKSMGTNKVAAKDVKKLRPAPNVKQDVPRKHQKQAITDREDFSDVGPKQRKVIEGTLAKIHAEKAMKRVSPKRPVGLTSGNPGYKGGR